MFVVWYEVSVRVCCFRCKVGTDGGSEGAGFVHYLTYIVSKVGAEQGRQNCRNWYLGQGRFLFLYFLQDNAI